MNINSSRYQDSCGFSDDDNDAAPEKRSRQWVGIMIALGLSVLFFFLVFYGPRQTVLNAFLYNCTLRIIFGLAVLRIARKLYGRLVPEILSSRENGPALIAGAGAVLYTLYHLFCVFALLSAPGASFSGLTSELIFIDLFLLQITTGFYEELCYRLLVCEGYFHGPRTLCRKLLYALISFGIFGALHLCTSLSFATFLYTGAVGLAFAVIYLNTRNIVIPMFLHFILDVFIHLQNYVPADGTLFITSDTCLTIMVLLMIFISLVTLIRPVSLSRKE